MIFYCGLIDEPSLPLPELKDPALL